MTTAICPRKIISGGQTGADRGGLDAGRELGLELGGWCPARYRSEDGRIPSLYAKHLTPTTSWQYDERTFRNARDSDGTAVFSFAETLTGGSMKTIAIGLRLHKPCKHFRLPLQVAVFRQWLIEYNIAVLNVAGPRASKECGIQVAVKDAMLEALRPIATFA